MQARLTLPDGEHTVALAYDSGDLFSRHLDQTWTFNVDTTAPAITVGSPATFPLLGARSSEIALRFSEAARLRFTLDGVGLAVDTGGSARDGHQSHRRGR